MKNKLAVLSLFLILTIFTNAQKKNWRQSHLNKNANYYEIVNSQNKKLSVLKTNTDKKSKKQIKQFERWAEYWRHRIMPDGSFVSSQHIYNEWLKEKEATSANKFAKKAGDPWTFIGPITPPNSSITFYPGMGRVNAIAFNSTASTIYVGAASGGIWKSTDGGTTWVAKGDNLPVLGISDIVIDPNDPDTLYIATGDFDGQLSFSVGVLKSTDAGETWNMTGLSTDLSEVKTISKLLIDPNESMNILATTKGAIKRSTDAGVTWTDVHTSTNLFNDIQYKTNSSTIIYATENNGNLLKSTDNGITWTVLRSFGTFNERVDIAQTAIDASLLIVLDSQGKVYKSINEGVTWTSLKDVEGFDSQGEYNQEIAISPIDKNLIMVGGIHGHRSKDGGNTWEIYLNGYWESGDYFYVHSDHHEMKFLPGTDIMLNGNDGGVFKGDASKDIAWTDLSSGLAITQYYSVSGTPLDANKLILGAQDNDVAIYDGANFVAQNPGSDGVEGLWDYTDDSKIAWSCSQSGYLERTMDGFATTEVLNNTPEGAPFVWQLEIHPTIPTTIYGGFQDINKSTDRGDSWTPLGSGVIDPIEAIAIAVSETNTIIFVSSGDELKKTINGGTDWTALTLPQVGKVKDVVINPEKTNEIYICYSGYSAGRVYKSTNGGTSWTDISGSLPKVPCLKMEYKTGSDELFLATDLGVYFRGNTATDWGKLDNGLPNVSVTDLAIHYDTNKLRISTLGRGLWEISIDNLTLGNEEHSIETSNVSVFPNPTKNKIINLELNNVSGNTNVLIYNIIGGVVKNFNTLNLKESINLNRYVEGVYFVKVTNQGKSITKKVILN